MAQSKRKSAGNKPITSHPLFAAVVALWFSALFGLGSLAIRPALFESLVLKSGIDLIIPAAAPPLGVTARILIAMAMAACGAVIGAILAHRMTRPKAAPVARKRGVRSTAPEPKARRPISAHDELGESLDAPTERESILTSRRRPLSVEHEERPFQPPEMAPLPGGLPPILAEAPVAPAATPAPFAPPAAPQATSETEAPLDLGAFVAPLAQPVALDWEAAQPVASATPQFEAPPAFAPFAAPRAAEPAPPVEPVTPPQTIATARPASLEMTDLALRLQESMARRRAARNAAARATEPEAAATAAAEAVPVAAPAEPPVDLAPPTAPFGSANLFLEPTPAPAIPAAPLAMPAALRPLDFDIGDDEADLGSLGLLGPRHLTMPPAPATAAPVPAATFAPEPEEQAAEEEAAPASEQAFGSLLDLGAAAPRTGFVRIDEPEPAAAPIEPVVIFPGQLAASPAAPFRRFDSPANAAQAAPVSAAPAAPAIEAQVAEAALRAALANLQRMSGAA
ncbi:hypothetical protein [Novosphingobium sp.]|uniref:hypothetical protein n=1 Tax=Novosphingobium sp. TaxID=1874826 RepID=UPI0022CCA73F|nr:hypothetical protein [Novosphingobium sp.]MCZ8018770.1 hypothetical protein [Novosphingobium sp.]MCZ8034775.1 hypothetical protein [Novosphingobium sp.]MCZ8052910.1 hypothetical protein [Novosphingobium sp.]MCZ8060668.1 hypothetical protein [Novosphingobium sp.]MCZ8230694.1 hypothetical protein [Novosphingobium sp.]